MNSISFHQSYVWIIPTLLKRLSALSPSRLPPPPPEAAAAAVQSGEENQQKWRFWLLSPVMICSPGPKIYGDIKGKTAGMFQMECLRVVSNRISIFTAAFKTTSRVGLLREPIQPL